MQREKSSTLDDAVTHARKASKDIKRYATLLYSCLEKQNQVTLSWINEYGQHKQLVGGNASL